MKEIFKGLAGMTLIAGLLLVFNTILENCIDILRLS